VAKARANVIRIKKKEIIKSENLRLTFALAVSFWETAQLQLQAREIIKIEGGGGELNFALGTNHNIVIKPYWLLGFIEPLLLALRVCILRKIRTQGEGCFSIQKQY
jgi:hypothetical protein